VGVMVADMGLFFDRRAGPVNGRFR
ncbi:MAG: hypothetical protein RIS17_1745, partial [Pseudomonadota bacterium]